jgi:hypothetical protein
LNLIEASISFRVRPSALILGKDSRKPWGKWDLLIAEAYQILQTERCSQCGLPVWICHSEDSDIEFDLVEETCFATRERETVHEADSKGAGYEEPKGTVAHPVPFTRSKKPMEYAMRDEYYVWRAEKREARSH